MRKCVFLLAILLIGGCSVGSASRFTEEELAHIPLAQREALPEVSGGFVLSVGSETIASDEIITGRLLEHFRPVAQGADFESFKARARGGLEQLLAVRVSDILLYQEARRDFGEQIDERLEKLAEVEVIRFVAGFGGDYARAEEALKEMGMDWADFKEYQKKMILSQSYIASQLPKGRSIAYSELVDCYNEMKEEFFVKPAMLRFRLIDIQPEKLEMEDANKPGLEQAKKLADELMKRLRQGEAFGELAKQYSNGHRAMFGGLWKPLQPGSLAEPYDILAGEAERIKPGQIAGPVEAGEHIFIVKLEEKRQRSFEPFEKVQSQIEARILFDRRKKAVDEFSAKLAEQAAIVEKDEFIDFCLEKIYRVCNR